VYGTVACGNALRDGMGSRMAVLKDGIDQTERNLLMAKGNAAGVPHSSLRRRRYCTHRSARVCFVVLI
jgi:hypothetical protein